jgi:hypothetical protein
VPHDIRISDETFELLGRLARPFVETTPESVIHRLATEALTGAPVEHSTGRYEYEEDIVELDPHIPENLAHTRILMARLGRDEIDRPNWNKLLRETHALAMERLGSLTAVRRVSSANMKEGRYEQEGYSYLPDSNISIQGLDSNLAWQNCLRIAKKLELPIEVEFSWHDKEGAAHPGERGRIRWSPSQS